MQHLARTIGVIVLIAVAAAMVPAQAAGVRLEHIGHYQWTDLENPTRHIMGVETVLDHHALVSTNEQVCLIDATTIAPDQPHGCIDVVHGLDSVMTYTRSDGYVYVDLRTGGFAILYLDDLQMTLTYVGQIEEPDVYFEKMKVVGDRLYVTAHAYGIRIYDLTDPALPTPVGSLTTGFDDAFAIDVLDDTAYVADGAGGLKVVDLTDETVPVIIAGENPDTARGTAEDVIVHQGHVYVASGSAGVAVYDVAGSSVSRHETPTCAKQLAIAGDYLAVADIAGVEVFRIAPDGSLSFAARESAMFRSIGGSLSLRMWHGIDGWGTDRIIVANWDSLDVFELVDPDFSFQPDIRPSTQRIRFAPTGGQQSVRITNEGSSVLWLTSITSDQPTFSVSPANGTLQPGEWLDLDLVYTGGQPGSALITIESNDPDEDPLPIELHGETPYPDPGEVAPPFVLDAWTMNHQTRQFEQSTFDLYSHAGKVVYFHVFSTW